jgi:uncharacterized protein (TIGR02996 family)
MSEPRDPALEALILAALDDDSAYQVYGDWLATRGHVRGELVALQARGLTEEADALLAAHPELWGELADLREVITATWRHGFIEQARIANTKRRLEPGAVTIPEAIGRLVDGPGRFLRDLTVGIVTYESNSYTGVTAALAERGPLPALRSIAYGDFRRDETELNWSTIGDLEPLYAAAPNLERLYLRSGSMQLGTIELPTLREFTIFTGGLDGPSAFAIASATWPRLEKLDLMFGSEGNPPVRTCDPIRALLAAERVPALRWLGIKNFTFYRDLVPSLLEARVVAQLRVLDLSMGTLTDADAAVLGAAKRVFGHLEQLIVSENYLTDRGLTALANLGCEIVSNNHRANAYAEPNGQRDWEQPDPGANDPDDDNRYVAVYE